MLNCTQLTAEHLRGNQPLYLLTVMKERPTKCIFKVNHIFRISILLLHVSALQERHLQGAKSILIKLYVYYVISAE
jgi:hypothetical protein